jgi:large subunit ribosomal protein L28
MRCASIFTCTSSAAVAAAAMTQRATYSTFPVNPETSAPAHGAPRGLLNKMAAMGLPPWAAWTKELDDHAKYRLSGIAPRSFLPKHPASLDGIWLNERVRERVRTSPNRQHVFRQLKYPFMRTGVWYSDALNHWVQIPHVAAAQYAIEKDGGFDNFILKRSGRDLKSQYGERIRRHILVRQKEIEKNFLLEKQAQGLAGVIAKELNAAESPEQVDTVLSKYGLRRDLMRRAVVVSAEKRGVSMEQADDATEVRA